MKNSTKNKKKISGIKKFFKGVALTLVGTVVIGGAGGYAAYKLSPVAKDWIDARIETVTNNIAYQYLTGFAKERGQHEDTIWALTEQLTDRTAALNTANTNLIVKQSALTIAETELEEKTTALELALANSETDTATIATLTTAKNAAETALLTAQNDLTAAQTALLEAQAQVISLQAIIDAFAPGELTEEQTQQLQLGQLAETYYIALATRDGLYPQYVADTEALHNEIYNAEYNALQAQVDAIIAQLNAERTAHEQREDDFYAQLQALATAPSYEEEPPEVRSQIDEIYQQLADNDTAWNLYEQNFYTTNSTALQQLQDSMMQFDLQYQTAEMILSETLNQNLNIANVAVETALAAMATYYAEITA